MQNKTAIVIVNTGTPKSPDVSDVRSYLREFLGDEKVINLPWFFRKVLVNCIIAPIRGPKSAKLYESIWTDEGSPLLVNTKKYTQSLKDKLGENFEVYMAMRYGSPSLEQAIDSIKHAGYSQIILYPLYPQYADSTTGTVIAEFERLYRKSQIRAEIKIVAPFFMKNCFIEAFARQIESYNPNAYDHILFSFHGLPVKQTERMHPGLSCSELNCKLQYSEKNYNCYFASCHETARKIASKLAINDTQYTVTFQSRLGLKWLKPYTDEVLTQLANNGVKKVLITSPAFVADCLETIHELDVEYKHLFIQSGGREMTMVKSLNDEPDWINCSVNLIKELIR